MISINLIGPMPISDGRNMILMVVDYYTKQVHLFPITKSIIADGVTGILFARIFPLHRFLHKIVLD